MSIAPSPAQIRAARALMNWSREDLAAATGLTAEGLLKVERGITRPHKSTIDRIVGTFLDQGVIFTDNDGVARQSGGVQIYKGAQAFAQWFDDIYETIREGGDICVSGCCEADYSRWIPADEDQRHTDRMNAIADKISCRVILCEGDFDFAYSSYVTYRWAPKEMWDRNPLYLYGRKLGVVEFLEDGPTVTVIDAAAAARAFRKIFDAMWETCKDIPSRREAVP